MPWHGFHSPTVDAISGSMLDKEAKARGKTSAPCEAHKPSKGMMRGWGWRPSAAMQPSSRTKLACMMQGEAVV